MTLGRVTRAATAAVRALLTAALAVAFLGATPGSASALPDLSVSVESTPASAAPGDTLTITGTVRNNGDQTAVDPTLNFTPSENATLESSSNCIFFVIVVSCLIGAQADPDSDRLLAPGEVATRSITLGSLQVGVVEVLVNATHNSTDGNPADNSVTSKTTVEPRSDLKLLFDVSPPSVTAGNVVTFTASVTNSAAGPARDARILIQMPPDLTVSHGGGCAVSALQVNCELGTVASLTTVERKLQILVPQEGSFTVIGTVSSSRPDPTPVDTQAQVSIIALEPIGPVIPPPPAAPAAPAPKPKAKPKPKLKKPVRVKIGLLAKGVPRKRCVRSRKLRLRLRQPGGAARSKAQIYIGKRRIKTVKGSALRKSVSLSRLPKKGRYKLLVVLTLRDGGRLSGRRTLRACSSSRR